MIDRTYCTEQLLRFSGLPGFPKTEDGRRSLVDAMQGAFSFADREALRRWADDVLRECDRCPVPRDAYRQGKAVSPAPTPAATQCFRCYDTGKATAEFLVTWRDGKRYAQLLASEAAVAIWQRHHEAEKRGDRGATLAPGRQMIYEVPTPCRCQPGPARLPDPPAERERYV